jgi:hypothetical protein
MRAASAARLVVGGCCIFSPARVLAAVGAPDQGHRRVRGIARALGVRLVVQGVLDLAWGRCTRRIDIAVELIHAASMVSAALIWPAHRRSASVSAAVATSIAVLDVTDHAVGLSGGPAGGRSGATGLLPQASRRLSRDITRSQR